MPSKSDHATLRRPDASESLAPHKLARKFLNASWAGTFPVDPAALIKNAALDDADKRSAVVIEGKLASEISGLCGTAKFIGSQPEGHFLCTFNLDDPEDEQRYNQARGIAHVLLGHCQPGKPAIQNLDFSGSSQWDDDAKAFAHELLLPAEYFIEMARLQNDNRKLAVAFGVPTFMVLNRLKQLAIQST